MAYPTPIYCLTALEVRYLRGRYQQRYAPSDFTRGVSFPGISPSFWCFLAYGSITSIFTQHSPYVSPNFPFKEKHWSYRFRSSQLQYYLILTNYTSVDLIRLFSEVLVVRTSVGAYNLNFDAYTWHLIRTNIIHGHF